jgi:hypothetical protein
MKTASIAARRILCGNGINEMSDINKAEERRRQRREEIIGKGGNAAVEE